MTAEIGLGIAIHAPQTGADEPSVSFFGQATLFDRQFILGGGNASGAWHILAQLDGTIPLRHTFQSLFGEDVTVPSSVPELTLSELSFTFDTGSGDYDAHGRTVATDISFLGHALENASLALKLASKSDAVHVSLQSNVVWQGVDASLEVHIQKGASSIRLAANQYEFLFGRAATAEGSNLLAVVCPGVGGGFGSLELAWAKSAWTSVSFRANRAYAKGVSIEALLTLANTSVGRSLQIDEPIRVHLDAEHLKAEIGSGTSLRKVAVALQEANAAMVGALGAPTIESPALATSTAETTSTSDDDLEEATNAQLTITGPLSLATVIDKLAPASSGSSTTGTWRDYVGKCLQLENIGLSLITSPKIGVSIVFDGSVQVGTWLGLGVRKATFHLLPNKLPFSDVEVEASLQGASAFVSIPPVARASAALRYDRNEGTNTVTISGTGRLQLLEQMSIGLLVNFEWQHRLFRGAFGFGFAKGFAVGPPGFQLTGIAGGFGYHRTMTLPNTVDDVATNAMVRLLQAEPTGDASSDPLRMLKYLHTFMQSLETKPHAWCIAFGITFKIVQAVDCMALVIASANPPNFDLALMGAANFPIGVSSFLLGHVQLALLARWSSQDNSLRILGALTNKSWLLHPTCQLHGGFAICVWFAKPYAGDFVVSLGGYSPLVPRKAHYPALDRVGFTWNASSSVRLFGELYFAVDRYGLQFGGRTGLKFTSSILDVDANFSFDVLAQWSPPFFQTRIRVGVQFELRAITTLRLGLVVDANVFGPPFGATFELEIDIKVWKRTFTISAGSTVEDARQSNKATPDEVIALAKNGQRDALQLQALGQSMLESTANAAAGGSTATGTIRHFRADDLQLVLTTAVPATVVYRQREAADCVVLSTADPLDVRPLQWSNVRSILVWDMQGPTNPAEWLCFPEWSRPLEALWYRPSDGRSTFKTSGRNAVMGLRWLPPAGVYGDVGLAPLPTERLEDSDAEVIGTVQANPGQTVAPQPATASDGLSTNADARQRTLDKLLAAGFDFGDCSAKGDFRPRAASGLRTRDQVTP